MSEARRVNVDAAFKRVLASGYAEEAHPGLLLDRGLEDSSAAQSGEATTARAVLFDHVATLAPSQLYHDAYARWKELLDKSAHVCTKELAVRGTLIVGLGGESVLETGITVQRAYGMPYIPGSALKGLARRYAEGTLAEKNDPERAKFVPGGAYHDVLFGRQDNAGHVTYYDAWYKPGSAPNDKPFVRDVITVHHPRYYTGAAGKREAPSDFDDPNPIPFVGARGTFLIAVECPDAQWAEAALALLAAALGADGAGGKTSSGYGRLYRIPNAEPPVAAPAGASGTAAPASHSAASQTPPDQHHLVAIIAAISIAKVKGQMQAHVESWRKLDDPRARVQVGGAILDKVTQTGDRKYMQKEWVDEVRAYVDAHAADV